MNASTAQTLAALAQFGLTILIPILAVFGRRFIAQLVNAFKAQAVARLSAEDRASLYAAVKIGLRAASGRGLSDHGLRDKAIEIASNHLATWGMPAFTPEHLADLIDAEAFKRETEGPQLIEVEPLAPDRDQIRVMVFEALNEAAAQLGAAQAAAHAAQQQAAQQAAGAEPARA